MANPITITNGSEKQNEWATRIAQREVSIMSAEIEATKGREGLEWYADALDAAMAKLVAGFSKIKAADLIAMEQAKNANIAKMLIKRARERVD